MKELITEIKKNKWIQVWAYPILFFPPFSVYWPFLTNWFHLHDDAHMLEVAVQYSPWQYFFIPHIYQLTSSVTLMPWLPLVDDFDYSLFGVNPLAFHIHELLTLGLTVALTFHLLRKLRVYFLLALITALAFMASPPMSAIASAISSRQNLIGLTFMMVCLIGFLNYESGKSPRLWYAVALIAYFFASTAKEYYVPIPIVLLAIPSGSLIQKIRRVWPFFLVTLLYLSYRLYMLDGFGGYQGMDQQVSLSVFMSATVWSILLKVPFYTFFRSIWTTALMLALAGISIAILAMKRQFNWFLLLTAVLALLMPTIGFIQFLLIDLVPGRWFMLFAFAFCVLIAIGLSRVGMKWVRNFLILIFLATIPLFVYHGAVPLIKWDGLSDELAHGIWNADGNRFYITSKRPFAGISATEWIYLTYLVKGTPGTFIALNEDILHWLPQHGKQAIRQSYFPETIDYPDINIKTISRDNAVKLFNKIKFKDGVMHIGLSINDHQKYRIIVFDKPFYVFLPYHKTPVNRVLWLYTMDWFHASGITNTESANLVIGEYVDGQWQYTPPIGLEKLMTSASN